MSKKRKEGDASWNNTQFPISNAAQKVQAPSAAERSEQQEWEILMQQARAYAHCNCPDAPKYHSNCQRHLTPILDKLDAELAAERQKNQELQHEIDRLNAR